MFLRRLMFGTAFSGKSLNLDMLDVLGSGMPEQKEALARMLGKQALLSGKTALTFHELAAALQGLAGAGFSIDLKKLKPGTAAKGSPFRQQAFYDFICASADAAEALQVQFQRLRRETKTETGFLKFNFNIFSHPAPVEKITADIAAFDKYCRKNGITFNEISKQLVQGEKPLSVGNKFWDARFLVAALGGAVLGFAGVNLGAVPLLSNAPGIFFGALPWLAAPFIGLNIFKSFSEHSIIKEAPTLLRFGAITAAGLAISLGAVVLMTGLIPPVDLVGIQGMTGQAGGGGGFSPMHYMLPIIGGFTAAALAYKKAKSAVTEKFNIAACVVAAGKTGEKAVALINRAFPKFIDVAGLPAIAVLMSATMATGGLGLLGMFAGYYATAFAGLAMGAAAMMGAYFYMGCRGKDFKELLSAAVTGFSLSSSSATMPKERECLKNMGISAKTRNTVVPLGGVFNMYGTSLYMGLTAFYATAVFNADPTMMQYLLTAGTVMAIALGAPGIPASNITLLEPVLKQTGLADGQISKIYAMVLPADRILDMTQTGLNVLGDMLAAVHPDRKKLRYVRVKNIQKIRREKNARQPY